ncbi:MAG: RidA family protein [Acidobacteriota bacterium]
MHREIIESEEAPQAIGPYSQAVRCGGLLYCSGQIGLVPASGSMVPGGVEAEARQALKNLEAVLQAGGSSWNRVLKTTIYLTRMDDFALVNDTYARFISGPPPARATVGVASLPKGALVEIDALAVCGEAR